MEEHRYTSGHNYLLQHLTSQSIVIYMNTHTDYLFVLGDEEGACHVCFMNMDECGLVLGSRVLDIE